ncbi:MAG: long-chain-acyl-CoA synthetase [Candidatus Binatia bacterium]|nr:MAG: long-chain-acyl-CoA synthetase [Candidatus Binatia bacterium]
MDLLSRVVTFVEDLRELPHYRRVQRALAEAGRRGMRTAGFVIREQAERIPDRVFLRFEEEVLTFGEYNRQVNRYANALRKIGVGRGEPVAIMMENSPDFLAAEGAVAKLGAVGALVNTNLRGAALAHVLGASGARVVLVDRACVGAVRELAPLEGRLVYARGGPEELGGTPFRSLSEALDEAGDSEPEIPELGLGDVFLYIYTSGTTGYPKPAIIRHARFTVGGHSLRVLLELEPGDCSYAPTPLYHGYSNFVGFAPALHAGTAFASRRKFSASHFLDDVERHGVTHFLYVGELCRYLLRRPPSPRDRRHRIRIATGPGLRPDIWREFMERFGIPRVIETYGQTEANLSLMNRRGRVGSVGRAAPFTHGRLKLVRFDPEKGEPLRGPDGFLVECRPGEVGELLSEISPRATMSFDGYVNKEENEKKILRNCFRPGDTYLRTGDLLRRDRACYYYFVDRVGDTFRWKGENVATQEVAELLNAAPGVTETAVYGVRVPGTEGRAGMAAVVLAEGASFDPVAYYAFAEKTLPSYARPLFVRIVPSMDVTGTLKHTKLRLQSEGYDPAVVRDPLYFRDDEARRYVPLTPELKEEIDSGRRRI